MSMSLVASMLWFAAAGDVGGVASLLDPPCGPASAVPVDAMDYDRRTALGLAASEGHEELVRYLLARGADANAEDRWGHRPLDDAKGHGVRRLLMEAGAEDGYRSDDEDASGEEGSPERGGKGEVEDEDEDVDENGRRAEDGGRHRHRHRHRRQRRRRRMDSEVFKGHPAEATSSALLEDDPGAALEVDRDELVFTGEVLGEGSYGWVREAEWRGTEVAVKCLFCTACGGGKLAADHRHQFVSEVSIMSHLRHPNILQFLGVCSAGGGGSGGSGGGPESPALLVTERLSGGNLEGLLRRMIRGQERVKLLDKVRMLAQLAQGVAYLHGRRPAAVIHRDLKPSNLFLDSHRNLKIGDFGLSVTVPHAGPEPIVDAPYRMTGHTGSFLYMAPEVFRGQEYSAKVDVYSFACVAYYLLEGALPLPVVGAASPEQPAPLLEPVAAAAAAADGARPAFRDGGTRHHQTTPELRDLIRDCWAADPGARPPFVEICERLRSIKQRLQRQRRGPRGHTSPLGAWAAAFQACTGGPRRK